MNLVKVGYVMVLARIIFKPRNICVISRHRLEPPQDDSGTVSCRLEGTFVVLSERCLLCMTLCLHVLRICQRICITYAVSIFLRQV